MKTKSILALTLLFVLFMAIHPVYSQKPEKVYSIIKCDQPFEWYITQAGLWKKAVDSDPKNAEGWLNYYTANRMARLLNPDVWQKQKGAGFMELNEIVKEMKREVPATFEYYHVKVWNDGYQNDENAEDILKAYALAPDRPEIYNSLVNYYEMKRDHEREMEICKKWFNSNEQSPNLLNYNYNVLMSLDDKGILITNGDNDTYPLWILQYALGIKKNVIVVNINLITVDSYRKKLFEENNIPVDEFKAIEQPSQDKIIQHLISRSGRPVYFANTLHNGYYKAFEKDLYMVGLAFKYSKESFDNIAVMRNHFERNYLMDYLRINFGNDISGSIVDRMNLGYLPFLIKLYEHYSLAGESDEADGVKSLARLIIQKGDSNIRVEDWFKKNR